MSVTSTRKILIGYTGDIAADLEFDAAPNSDSPCLIQNIGLQAGDNSIAIASNTPKAVTIIPPTNNNFFIRLKGVGGDTGYDISPTQPTTIALGGAPQSPFILSAGSVIQNVRFVWS